MVAPELINTDIPHYFIVVGIEDSDNYLVLCTSQQQKKEDHFAKHNFDLDGLVYIKPNDINNLTKDTFINCNDYYCCETAVLSKKILNNELSFTGLLELKYYD